VANDERLTTHDNRSLTYAKGTQLATNAIEVRVTNVSVRTYAYPRLKLIDQSKATATDNMVKCNATVGLAVLAKDQRKTCAASSVQPFVRTCH